MSAARFLRPEVIQVPEEIAKMAGGGWAGWLVAAVFGCVMAFRRIWHADLVSGANSKGAVDTIQRLYDLLDAERRDKAALHQLLSEATGRADKANHERNEAIREIGDIKSQLATLQAEVRMLREERGHHHAD